MKEFQFPFQGSPGGARLIGAGGERTTGLSGGSRGRDRRVASVRRVRRRD